MTILAEILIIALYFWGYERKLQATINLKPDFLTLDFFSTVIANGFFFHADISKYFGLGYLLTVITVLFLIWGIYQIMTSKNQKKLVFWVGIIFIGYMLLFALSITIGRFTFGLGQASETRYITFSMLAPLGIYFILESFNKRNIFRIILILILLGGLFSYHGYIND